MLEVVGISQLSSAERQRVERIIAQAAPESTLLGVAITRRSWDLRPVVRIASEAETTIIRLLGPEVSLSSSIHARMTNLLDALKHSTKLSSKIVDYGVFEGQLWYRREVTDHTLAEVLAMEGSLPR